MRQVVEMYRWLKRQWLDEAEDDERSTMRRELLAVSKIMKSWINLPYPFLIQKLVFAGTTKGCCWHGPAPLGSPFEAEMFPKEICNHSYSHSHSLSYAALPAKTDLRNITQILETNLSSQFSSAQVVFHPDKTRRNEQVKEGMDVAYVESVCMYVCMYVCMWERVSYEESPTTKPPTPNRLTKSHLPPSFSLSYNYLSSTVVCSFV